MKTIELDLTGCKYLGEIHKKIQKAFDFPYWYGANWDAFWDLLWSECDANKVLIKGEKSLPNELKKEVEIMHTILERNAEFCKKSGLGNFYYQIID